MKVINLIGVPGIGKSTIAADLFAEMKWRKYKVELVNEYAKDLTWEEHFNVLADQNFLFAQQNRKLERLRGKVDYVITDSPLLLVIAYAPSNYYDGFERFVRSVWSSYNNFNVMLTRKKEYHAVGRTQTEDQARSLDEKFIQLFKNEHSYRIPGDVNAKHLIIKAIENQEHTEKYVQFAEKHAGYDLPLFDNIPFIPHNEFEKWTQS